MSAAPCLEREQAAPRASGAAPFVLVTGGKGGVGKTVFATNLAVQLAAKGRRVLLVDLDLGLANVDVLLRLSPARSIEDALSGRCAFADCLWRGPAGLSVLPASSGTLAMAQLDAERRARLLAGIAELAREHELVLGDTAAGIGHDVLGFAGAADRVLLVTTPAPAALTDAYGLMKALDAWARESRRELPTPELIVNQAVSLEEAERTALRLRRVCERFLCRSPRAAGWLPVSSDVRRSAELQEPFALRSPGSLAARCLGRIGERIERVMPAVHPSRDLRK